MVWAVEGVQQAKRGCVEGQWEDRELEGALTVVRGEKKVPECAGREGLEGRWEDRGHIQL